MTLEQFEQSPDPYNLQIPNKALSLQEVFNLQIPTCVPIARIQNQWAMLHSRAYSRGFLGFLLCATLPTVASLNHQPQIYFARPGWAGMLSKDATKFRGHVDFRKSGAVRQGLFGMIRNECGGDENSRSSMGMNKHARLVQLQVEFSPSSPMCRH